MALAQIGSLTNMLQAAATATGAGVVLGSVAMGAVGLALGWPRSSIERRALTDGYFGGILGAAAALADVVMHYIVK